MTPHLIPGGLALLACAALPVAWRMPRAAGALLVVTIAGAAVAFGRPTVEELWPHLEPRYEVIAEPVRDLLYWVLLPALTVVLGWTALRMRRRTAPGQWKVAAGGAICAAGAWVGWALSRIPALIPVAAVICYGCTLVALAWLATRVVRFPKDKEAAR